MPTKRIFALVVMTVVGIDLVKGPIKLWAYRTLGEGNQGTARPVAEAVAVI